MSQDFSELTRILADLPRKRTNVEIRPDSRPPPEPKHEPSDHETTIAVLEGRQTPKVCPFCGRPWNQDARCVCQEPAPYLSPWAKAWRWLVSLVSPKPPPVVVLQGPTRQARPKAPVREYLIIDTVRVSGPPRPPPGARPLKK